MPPPSTPHDADFPLVRMLAATKPTAKAERTFHELVGRIARAREELAQWQAYELRYNRRVVAEIEPLQAQLRAGQRQLVELIERLLGQPLSGRRGRAQRDKLTHLLLDVVSLLLEHREDEALVALHDKYSDVSRDEARRLEMQATKSMLNDVFGVDVGDDHGATTTEELFEHAQRTMDERAEAEERGAAQRREDRNDPDAGKRSAAQTRREQTAKEVSQSLREIYRKLASALHPDREQDPEARQRKTLLMQRVNQAYDASDLLSLLGLQLEIEQIDAAHLSSVTPKRLAHYNKVLREQLADLDAELRRHVEPYRRSLRSSPTAPLTPAMVDRDLTASVKQLRAANRELREDLVVFRDPELVRQWLEYYEIEGGSEGAG